jgi:hypothetical protein
MMRRPTDGSAPIPSSHAMNRPARIAALLIALSLAAPAQAYQRRDESWGKPGISYLQYRTDAVECAYDAETKAPVKIPAVDLTFMTDSAQVDAQPQMDLTNPNADIGVVLDYAAQSRMHMNKHWRNVARQLEPALESCLRGRGYQKFRLTDAQKDELKRLTPGTRARNVYLWNLAVDPGVLKSQLR